MEREAEQPCRWGHGDRLSRARKPPSPFRRRPTDSQSRPLAADRGCFRERILRRVQEVAGPLISRRPLGRGPIGKRVARETSEKISARERQEPGGQGERARVPRVCESLCSQTRSLWMG